jgi:hypothetical protein
MTTVDKLLQQFGLTALPFDRAVPPEGLLHHASFAEALERLRFAVDCSSPRPARGSRSCSIRSAPAGRRATSG